MKLWRGGYWQEMEGKDKVVCVVDKACENGRVRREVHGEVV